jgi:ribosomal protein S18 acetylase RimI-like enzyme
MATMLGELNQEPKLDLKGSDSPPLSTTSSGTSYPVRVVPLSEYKEAAACLADAFAVDEVARYLVDMQDTVHHTEAEKWANHVKILEYMTAAHCISALVTTCGPDYDAVALWCPPKANIDGWLTLFRSGLWRLWFQFSTEGRKRFFNEFLPLLHDTKHDVLKERDENSWYLVYLGAKKSARGKGYAKKLIQDATAQVCVTPFLSRS